MSTLKRLDTQRALTMSDDYPKNITRRTTRQLWASVTDPFELETDRLYVIEIYNNPLKNKNEAERQKFSEQRKEALRNLSLDAQNRENTFNHVIRLNLKKLDQTTDPKEISRITKTIEKAKMKLDEIQSWQLAQQEKINVKFPINRLLYTGRATVKDLDMPNKNQAKHQHNRDAILNKYFKKLQETTNKYQRKIDNATDSVRKNILQSEMNDQIILLKTKEAREVQKVNEKYLKFNYIKLISEPLASSVIQESKQAFTKKQVYLPCIKSCVLELVRGEHRNMDMVDMHVFKIAYVNNQENTNNDLEVILYQSCERKIGTLCKIF